MNLVMATGAGFIVSLTLGLASSACSGNCHCGDTPPWPEAQSVEFRRAVHYTEDDSAISPLGYFSGWMTTSGNTLVIDYGTNEGNYTVTYEISE